MADPIPAVREIFSQALEIESAEERLAFLERACAGDAGHRAAVDALLIAHGAAGEFLESPAAGMAADGDAVIGLDLDPRELLMPPGTVIGRYRLLERIGEGGYGTVFMAEQTSPVRRRVALKIVKAGMDTRQVIARFEAERQALALMDHPNIAKVFDAGVTDAGRPYFVMELVKGVPITKYCDEHRLTPQQRLELFIQVCQAVQHAHQKGIIHRDLKPSNVLVAQYDGKPVPKVIDFGVAKATGQRLTERTIVTGLGDVIGTLEYMSPEQAGVNQLDVDTRSDIYSLGVLLYELLTGTTTLEHKRVAKSGLVETLRVIREEEPPKPSTRLSTSEQLPAIAANRGLEPKKLTALVRGELDWIVMKALEKDRARRYETANGLARDMGRYLNGEAVLACPPSAGYRFGKFARRNQVTIATTSLVAAALLLGLVVSTWQAVRANRASAIARQEADKQQAINKFLNEMLQSANPWARTNADKFKGKDATVVQVCDAAVAKLDAGALKDRPEIEAALRETIGETYGSLARQLAAEVQKREALRLGRLVYGPDHPVLARYMIGLASNLRGQQLKLDEAETLMRDGLTMQKKFLAEDDPQVIGTTCRLCDLILVRGGDGAKLGEAEQLARQARSPEQLAYVFRAQGKFIEAEAQFRQAVANTRKQFGDDDARVANILINFATFLEFNAGKLAEAETNLREAVRIGNSASVKVMLGRLLWRQGKSSEAEPFLRDGIEQERINLGEDHPRFLVDSVFFVAFLGGAGKSAEAEAAYRQFTQALSRANPTVVKNLEVNEQFAHSQRMLADHFANAGRLDESEQLLQNALAIFEKLMTRQPTPKVWYFAADTHRKIAGVMVRRNNNDGAEKELRQALELHHQCVARFHYQPVELPEWADCYVELAGMLSRSGRLDECVQTYRQALAMCEKLAAGKGDGDHHIRVNEFRSGLVDALRLQGSERYRNGQWKEAIQAFETSMELRDGGDGNDWFFLAMCRWQLNDKQAAHKWYDQAVAWMDKNQPKSDQLNRFRTEAEELLKLTEEKPTTTTKPQSN